MGRRAAQASLALYFFSILLLAPSIIAQEIEGQSSTLLREQIKQHEQGLASARAAHNQAETARELNFLGSLYRQVGETQKALADCNEALSIERNRANQATTQNIIGRIYTDIGEEQKALDIYNEILPVFREVGNRQGEATTLFNYGRTYNHLGDQQKSLDYYNQALPIWQSMGNRQGEATTLDGIGRAYSDMSHDQKALEYLNRALPIWHAIDGHSGEAMTNNNIGKTYADMGKKQEALDYYNRSLSGWREVGNAQGEALTIDNIGRLYGDLGQKQQALDYYNQALPIYRAVGSRNGEALVLNDVGLVYAEQGDALKALDYYSQALPVWREAGNRRGEALTLTNMGRAHEAVGEFNKALEFDNLSLVAWREVKETRGEAFALSSVGRVYAGMGQPDKALPSLLAGLALAKTAGDPIIQGGIETSLMIGFRNRKLPEEAIFFGTEAVNSYQLVRRDIAGLDRDLQTSFAYSKSYTYRELAELLVQQDRLGEAEHVLDLLKEEELKEVLRGADDSASAKSAPLPLTGDQQKAQDALATPEQAALAVAEMSAEYAVLQGKTARTPGEDAQLKTLEAKIEAGNGEVSDFFRKTLYPELAQSAGAQNANALLGSEKADISQLQSALAQLGPQVLGIRLLMGEQHAYAIIVTAQARKKFELPAAPADLRRKVLQVRDALRNPKTDPKPSLAELYAMVVGPFAGELAGLEHSQSGQNSGAKGRVPTLLWSLDGAMRYLPMSTLYDGKSYLVERFNNIVFTPESYGHMAASPAGEAGLRILAMGLSKSYGGLPALPGVLPELDAVVHDPSVPESHGPMDGVLLPNERFTFAALKSQLGAGAAFPVVHIASHFVMTYGSGDEPYLMLGGETAGAPEGYPLTLSKLEDSPISFHGTHLLTLSACSTARGDVADDGLEVDSLGMVAEQKDAEAVLATLWDVNDASTSSLMSDFYTRWVKDPASGKAEALRQAQLALLRGAAAPASVPHDAGYSHPFYWAPFVLIGNYQ